MLICKSISSIKGKNGIFMFFRKIKPIENLYKENSTELMNIADLSDIPDLPVYHTLNKPKHLLLWLFAGLFFFVISLIGFFSIPYFIAENPNTAWFLIGVVMGVTGFWVFFQSLTKIAALRHRYTLAVYDNKVAFLNFKNRFEEISFENAYLAESVTYRGGGTLYLYYISFALIDDKLYYQTHRATLEQCKAHEAEQYAMLLNALIQEYHRKHNLEGKVPKIKFIPQR